MAEYDINYEDEKFQQVESDKNATLSNLEQTYAGMIDQTDKYYQDQINASQQWADKQSQLQQEKTDFTIEQIEQQKAQAQKDYTKEQSGAYVDWRKQSNEYGTEAEKMASAGLQNTGYSESSQVSMYNTYQNRVATARESYNRAVLNYDNAIKDARLQNNAALAEIAYQALQTQLELSLQGFQYKNNLILEQTNKKLEVDNMYYNRYQDVLDQINHENSLAEQIRQFNQSYELQSKEYEEGIRQFNEEMELKRQQLEEEIRQYNEQMALAQAKSKKSSSGSKGNTYIPTKGDEDGGETTASKGKISSHDVQSAINAGMAGPATMNVQSVADAGYSGKSVEQIAKAVADGKLNAKQVGNQIYVSRNEKYDAVKNAVNNVLNIFKK